MVRSIFSVFFALKTAIRIIVINYYFMYSVKEINRIELGSVRIEYVNNKILIDGVHNTTISLLDMYKDTFKIADTNLLSDKQFEFIKHIDVKLY